MPLWAKVDVDMPTDEKLFGQPLATRHLWTCLICLAKRQDHAGAINGYDCALLASRFNIPRKCVAKALTHYQLVRMVELDADGTIRLINFLERQGPEDTSSERASRYYENHRETIREKRKVSRAKSNGVLTPSLTRSLTPVSRETVSLEVEVEVEEEKEVDQERATTLPLGAKAPAAAKPTVETARAYIEAFKARWEASPFQDDKPDATANGLLARIVKKLGQEEAPFVAAYFLTTNDRLYVNAKHPLELLLRDGPKLRAEWAGARKSTAADARLIDQSQSNAQGWLDTAEKVIAKEKKHGVV